MKETQKSGQPKGSELPDSAVPLSSPPIKTPMYTALNAERYQRQEKIKQIQKDSKNILLCYVAGNEAAITREDIMGIMELLHMVPQDSNVDFLIHTGGGDIDAAEKIVSVIRATVGKGNLRIIVPDFAKSAGTLIAIAADKIVMSDSSELGPIDPQFFKKDSDGNIIRHSVMNYLEAYDTLTQKLRSDPNDLPSQLMFSKLDPTSEALFRSISNRARDLAEKHLNRYMFQRKTGNHTKIASDLMDTKRWLSHGQMISHEHARTLGLEIEYLKPDSEEWRSYWSLYCLQRLSVKDGGKLFESDYASMPM